MVDSWGKIPPGILNGDLYDLGDFDQCMAASHHINDISGTFDGQFCLAQIQTPMPDNQNEIVQNLRELYGEKAFRDGTNMLPNALRNGLRMVSNTPQYVSVTDFR